MKRRRDGLQIYRLLPEAQPASVFLLPLMPTSPAVLSGLGSAFLFDLGCRRRPWFGPLRHLMLSGLHKMRNQGCVH